MTAIQLVEPTNLHPHMDIKGNAIRIGDRVRSYDFCLPYDGNHSPIIAANNPEAASFIEGQLIAIEPEIEGCPRYQIAADLRILGGERIETISRASTREFHPPVNGTPFLDGVTAGVFRA